MARQVAARGEGRQRVLDAALALFSERGVSGTSLQDIADRMGVTKAAVYFQFKTKHAIVLAVLEPVMDGLEGAVLEAAAQPNAPQRQELMLTGLVDLAVQNGADTVLLFQDRFVADVASSHERLQRLARQMTELLSGPSPSRRTRVAVAVAVSGIVQARANTGLADVNDTTLRRELRAVGRAALDA